MNTSDMIGKNEVMVCSGVDSSMIAKGINMVDCRSWKVHALYTSSTPNQAVGDVVVFAEDGCTAAAFTGCRFSKLDMSRLERLLDSANRPAVSETIRAQGQNHPVPQHKALHKDAEPEPAWTSSGEPYIEAQNSAPPPVDNNLRQILETYTGVAATSISAEAILGDLGLDSLAATEMAGELQSSNQISLDGLDLLSMSVKELEAKLYGAALGSKQPTIGSNDPGKVVRSLSAPSSEAVSTSSASNQAALSTKLSELLIEVTGITLSAIKPNATLDSLGVDSLAMTEITSALSELSQQSPDTDNISTNSTVEEVILAFASISENGISSLEGSDSDFSTPGAPNIASSSATSISSAQSVSSDFKVQSMSARMITDPAKGLLRSEADFETAATNRGYRNYWGEVALEQDTLTLAYILEAFKKLGVDFASIRQGETVPQINYLPKHRHVIARYLGILAKHDIIKLESGGTIIRGDKTVFVPSASRLHDEFVRSHPQYAIEARLIALTGPKLAECLTGEIDPIRLLFGSPMASKILEEYYGSSTLR